MAFQVPDKNEWKKMFGEEYLTEMRKLTEAEEKEANDQENTKAGGLQDEQINWDELNTLPNRNQEIDGMGVLDMDDMAVDEDALFYGEGTNLQDFDDEQMLGDDEE